MAKVIELFDYRNAELPERLFAIKIRQQEIDKKLFEAAERFLTIEAQTGEIVKNDIVAVSMESKNSLLTSECERFRVGRKFFYPEIETQIPGHKAGDTFVCQIDGEDVSVHVISVKRRIVPVLTDALVAKIGLDDIQTVAEYTNYVTEELVEEDKEKKQGAVCTLVNRQLIEKSVFELEENEVEDTYQQQLQELEAEIDDPEEFEKLMFHVYHAKTMDAAKANMKKEVEKQIKITAVAEKIALENGKNWSEQDYDEFVKASVNERVTEEEFRADFSLEEFIQQQKLEYLQEQELDFFDDRFHSEVIA